MFIDIEFEAHDDHGIATAELVVYDESEIDSSDEPKIITVKPIPLGHQRLKKHVMGSTQLDLSELGIEEGVNISYAVRVTDNRVVQLDTAESSSTQSSTPSEKENMPDESAEASVGQLERRSSPRRLESPAGDGDSETLLTDAETLVHEFSKV